MDNTSYNVKHYCLRAKKNHPDSGIKDDLQKRVLPIDVYSDETVNQD